MGFFGSILHGSGGWAFTHRLSLFPTREIMGPEVLFWHRALPPEVEMMLRSHTVLLSLSSAACVGFLGFFLSSPEQYAQMSLLDSWTSTKALWSLGDI